MSIVRNTFLFITLSFFTWNCSQNEAPLQNDVVSDQVLIYQELLYMEYALLNSDYKSVLEHSAILDGLLKQGYNLFCPGQSAQIDGARLSNQILVQHIQNNKISKLSNGLRILKATIINLETDDNYDIYLSLLWRFEEDMDIATNVAIDPMLDLNEWNEFKVLVDCMNDSWATVKMHRPSSGILNYNSKKYKNQSVYKIYLENAIVKFNLAVSQIDYIQYPLCELAEDVREAYKDYIFTFVPDQTIGNSFLAKL